MVNNFLIKTVTAVSSGKRMQLLQNGLKMTPQDRVNSISTLMLTSYGGYKVAADKIFSEATAGCV